MSSSKEKQYVRDFARRKKQLKQYLRKKRSSDGAVIFKFYLLMFAWVFLVSSVEHSPFLRLGAFAVIVLLVYEWIVRTTTVSDSLALAEREHRLDWLIEDFEAGCPLIGNRVRVGDEWLFGQGALTPVRIESVTNLYITLDDIPFVRTLLIAEVDSADKKIVLCRYYAKDVEVSNLATRILSALEILRDKPREYRSPDLGALALLLSKRCPNITISPNLLDEITPQSHAVLSKKLEKRSFQGVWGTCSWKMDVKGALTVRAGKGTDCHGKSPWSEVAPLITSARFEQTVTLPADCSGLFAGCASMTSLVDAGWDTSQVKSMKYMFRGCSSLCRLPNAATWNTTNVENMTCAFDGCHALQYLPIEKWETSSVRNMAGLFWECSALSRLNLQQWNTSRVQDMRALFLGCTSLQTLALPDWNTARLEDASGMFEDCKSLSTLDLSHWDTARLTNTHAMLKGCTNLDILAVSQDLANLLKNDQQALADCSEAELLVS